jgi:hypothetical protein
VRYLGRAISISCLVAIAAAFGAACQGSAEGQPCSVLGNDMGDSECKDGLVCTPQGELNGGYTKDVCCPSNRATATTLICQLPANPVADASAPTVPDAASDAGTDSGSEDTGASVTDSATGDSAPPADAKTDGKTEPGDARADGA